MSRIFCVHPKLNLLDQVAQDLLSQPCLEAATVLLPNRRAVNFLEYYLAKRLKAPQVLPRLRPIEDWALETYVAQAEEPEVIIHEYDQAYLAYEAAREVLSQDLAWEKFFPWALKLVQLFREFDLEFARVHDLVHLPEDQAPEKAREILERIGQIYQSFGKKLAERGFITPAKVFRRLAEGDLALPEGPVYLVGFYALTEAEDRLFRRLYDQGASIYWHADPDHLPELYVRWRKQWRVEPQPLRPQTFSPPEILFFEAHDLHAELQELRKRLPERITDPRPDQRAIVLLSSGNLIPLLYHLPEGPVNLTMGYPLRLTGLYTFLENLFSLLIRYDQTRGYPVREFLNFLRSPYLPRAYEFEAKLRQSGAPFVSKDFCLAVAEDFPVQELFEKLIEPVQNASTPWALAQALRGAFLFLQAAERASLLEREFIASFSEVVLPVLEESLFAQVSMEKRALFRLVTELLSSVQVPFQGEPLRGLQVMGLLETRLLSFREIFVLDLNEGVLPDVEDVNPLLPHGIRTALGLPERERDEAILRYHFERLLQTADRVHLFWQFQTNTGEAKLDAKKVRSRYVERLLWEVEKEEGRFFEESSRASALKKSFIEIDAQGLAPKAPLPKAPSFREAILQRIQELSPSLLEVYLKCPLRFFYQEILRLDAPKTPDEMAYDQLGTAVHEALKDFFEEATQGVSPARIKKEDLSLARLEELFESHLKRKPFYKYLSPARKFFIFYGARFRLQKFLENHPEETVILALEKTFRASLDVPGVGRLTLKGQMDRIDQREEGGHVFHLILDYKTGRVSRLAAKLIDPTPWGEVYDHETLKLLAKDFPDLQLPFYVYLYGLEQGEKDLWASTTAAYVKLRERGQEEYWIPFQELQKNGSTYASWLQQQFPALIRYLVRHMLEAPCWYPAVEEEACGYCPYQRMCQYTV